MLSEHSLISEGQKGKRGEEGREGDRKEGKEREREGLKQSEGGRKGG